MTPISRSLYRTAILSFLVITLLAVAFLYDDPKLSDGIRKERKEIPQTPLSNARLGRPIEEKPAIQRLDLKEEECRTNFPGLFKSIDDAVKRGKFVLKKSDPEYKGLVQGRIKDGSLYIISVAPDTTPQIIHQRTAILSQLHRALLTSPTSLPNTHFAFVINDSPKNNSWAFSIPNKSSSYNTWLMPSFAFWSWPSSNLGTFDHILERIENVEENTKWEKKDDKVVWRGTPWFNPLGYPNLRKDLIKVTKGKEWADVQALNISSGGEAMNALKIEEFCKYKYIVYTEGVTYSGRLPYHQACESVLLTPPLTYLTHTAQLIKPILSEDLLSSFGAYEKTDRPAYNGPPSGPPPSLLPMIKDYREANAIYLSPNFNNLEITTLFLRKHSFVAQRIAQNMRETIVGGGYLSPAAETCYWRALIRGWASVAVLEENGKNKWGDEVGERFENWILKAVEGERREDMRGRSGG